MAKGRMINSKITLDKKVHDLSCDTSRLAFTWLVSFADVEGRTPGDPAIVKSLIFPRRADVSAEQIETYINEWAVAGLILWYEAEDDLWIQFPKFDDNQKGLRKDREAPSNIPAPQLRSDSGQTPEQVPVNRTEQKRTEQVAAINSHYQNNIQMLTPHMADVLALACEDYPHDWIIEAIDISVERNARNWRYAEGILKNWKQDGKNAGKKSDTMTTVERMKAAGYGDARE